MMPSEERKAAIRKAWTAYCEAGECSGKAARALLAAKAEEESAGRAFVALDLQVGELSASYKPRALPASPRGVVEGNYGGETVVSPRPDTGIGGY